MNIRDSMYMYSSKPERDYAGRDFRHAQRPRQRQPDLENEDSLNSYKIKGTQNIVCDPFPDSADPDGCQKSERMNSNTAGNIGRSGRGDYRATEEPFGISKRDVYPNSRRNGDSFGNTTREEYGDSWESRPVETFGSVVNGNTHGHNNNNLPLGSSNVFYGYGGPFRVDADSDRNTDISDMTDDLTVQPWMDKISGGTFKRNYLDRVSFRPTLQHDTTMPLQNVARFHGTARDMEPLHPKDKKRGKRTIVVVILGILLIGVISAVLAWFLAQKGDKEDTEIRYYVVTGEMSLDQEFYIELNNSSSPEFRNLSAQFCDAIKGALQKNTSEYGDRYRHCDVTGFRNGSIVVLYTLYYEYTTTIIMEETVQKDINDSLTTIDSDRTQLSNFVVITTSVTVSVKVETYITDPLTTTSITSAAPIPTTTPPAETTTKLMTGSEITTTGIQSTTPATEITTDSSTSTTAPTTEITTNSTTSTTAQATVITTDSTTSTTAQATEITTDSTTSTTAQATEYTTDSATSTTAQATVITTDSTTSTTAQATEITTDSTTSTTAQATEIATDSTTSTTVQATVITTDSTTSTTAQATEFITNSTTSTTAQATEYTTDSTTSTTAHATEYSTDSTTSTTAHATEYSTDSATSTTAQATEYTTDSTTSTTAQSTEYSTDSTTSTTAQATEYSTDSTTSTTAQATEYTTDNTTSTTAQVTQTEITTDITTSTTAQATEYPTDSTTSTTAQVTQTEITTDSTTSTTAQATEITTDSTTSTMAQETEITTDSTTSTTETVTSNNSTASLTTTAEMTTTVKYTADVRASSIVATVGELATSQACVVTPHGEWLQINVSTVHSNGATHVIGKLDYNQSFENPSSLDRFSTSIRMNGDTVEVMLTLNLTNPTADICSWDNQYTVYCSVIMNDDFLTKEVDFNKILVTAPMTEVSIDSEIHYNEGEQMTVNCTTKVDPNYSSFYVELIKDSNVISTIPGPSFGTRRNSDCSIDFNWITGNPNPLTSDQNGVIVRCVVTNTELNKTNIAEKKLNVSSAGVAFTRYFQSSLTETFQEIECIARSASSVFQQIILSKDGVDVAVMNSSGTASKLINTTRYSVSTQSYDGDERLVFRISSVECEDQGMYGCKMLTKDNSTITAPTMTFIVEGAKPILTLHPDIYEPFARLNLNHICSTEHTGSEERNNYLEVQLFKPNAVTGFKYSNRIAESEKMLDPTNNITYINITGTAAQFLLVSDWKSNVSCYNKETITFLLDLTMEFNNGTVKCVMKNDMMEHSVVESRITVIPGNFCDGYEDRYIRKHPNNDCNSYVVCTDIDGKMYAVGNRCPIGQCMDFTLKYCVPCDASFTCEELTTPGPTTTMTTLPPGTRYVSCNDSTHSERTTAIITCVVLNNTFISLNITFLSESSQGNEEKIAEILPDGTVQYQSLSDVTISTDFASSPMILLMRFPTVNCSSNGRYSITGRGTDPSIALSVETFKLDVIGNLTAFKINASPIYQDGTQIEFNCTATLDESHADIKAYYKRQSESSFTEIEGTTAIIGRIDPHCLVDVVWKPSNLMIADGSLNNTNLKCSIMQWPLANRFKSIIVESADVAFDVYKIEANISSTVSAKCITRNVDAIKAIVIRRAANNETVAMVTLTGSQTSSTDGVTVSHTNNSLSMSITSLSCWDEGYYTCSVVKPDDTEIVAPAQLHIQPKNPPKEQLSTLSLNIDIKENSYDSNKGHTCTGDVGYPENEGYLSITITNPNTNVSYTYDKKTVTDAMKTPAASPLKFGVNLASGLSILIVEDNEPTYINCTGTKTIKFLLQVTSDWNKAIIQCSVKTDNGEIKETVAKDEIYVIPKSLCDDTNGTDAFRPHEKIDGCRTYVRCYNYKPTGQICLPNLCFDHGGLETCTWCRDVNCESEMAPTTEGSTELATTTIPPSTTPAWNCPLQSCTSDSEYEGKTATLSCSMNMSVSYKSITVMKNGQALFVVYSNSTTVFSMSKYADKYDWTLGSSSIFTIKNVSCSDKSEYTFTVETDDGRTCSERSSFGLKVKPAAPKLTIDYTWEIGKNQGMHICSGDVGNPAGTLSFEIRNGTSGNYTSYVPSLGSETTKLENCSTTLDVKFSIDFTSINLQGYYIRCVAENPNTLQTSDPSPASDAVMINPLPPYPCIANGLHPYPGDCNRYLNCFDNITRVSSCGTSCFHPNGGFCGDCSQC